MKEHVARFKAFKEQRSQATSQRGLDAIARAAQTARPKTSTRGSSKPRSLASRMARSSAACVGSWDLGSRFIVA